MEVHHHPKFEKKGFKEYFLEFLMIFLAVTLGFFAEGYREHVSDRAKEKDYMKSFLADLRTDSAFLEISINKLIPYHITWLDSAVHLFLMHDLRSNARVIYQAYFLGTAWTYNFHPTERTLSQLRNEGFRLIKNKNAAGIISQLEDEYKFHSQEIAFVQTMQNDIDFSAALFADKNVVDKISRITFQKIQDDPFVTLQLSDIPASATINTDNTEKLMAYAEKLKNYSYYLQANIKLDNFICLIQITKTINVLRKEYHLE